MPTVTNAPAKTDAMPQRAATKAASEASSKPKPKAATPRAAVPAKPAKKTAPADAKPAKVKVPLVRDSFTMPAADFDLIATMKLRALEMMRPTKKSELLRAGLHALAALNDTRFRSTLNALTPLKPGRPKKAG